MTPPAPPRRPAKPDGAATPTEAPEAIPADAGQGSGFRDGFGAREASFDADGHPVELLRLLPGFDAVAPALSERIAQLKDFHRTSVARALRLERDDQTGLLTLVSEHAAGLRLRDVLRRAVERSVVPNVGATLFVMRRLFSTAESLHTLTGVAYIAVAPERIVLTPRGAVVIVEPAVAGAIEAITATSYEPRRDIAGIALVGISMLLGRAIGPVDALDALNALLKEATDAAGLLAGDTFANALRRWLHRAIIVEPYGPFQGFRDAGLTLERIKPPKRSGCRLSRRKLKAFLDDLAFEPLSRPETAALEADRIRALRASQVARRLTAVVDNETTLAREAQAERDAEAARAREAEAAQVREEEAARAREEEAARAREAESARVREEEAARARDAEAARMREEEAARVREEKAARVREEEAARAREEEAERAREEEAARLREEEAARVREEVAAWAREEEAARVREEEAAAARAREEEEAARAREAEAERVREEEAARAREEAAAKIRAEEAARAREAEAAAARAREAEAARVRKEEEAARAREAEAVATRAREAEAARVRKEEEAARAREAEAAAARAREAEAARIRKEEEAARAREAEAARVREKEAARAREAEAARAREAEAAAARAREAEAARVRKEEAARARDAEAERLREEAARAREAEAARVREEEAARAREKEAARVREEEAAQAREEEAARAREAKAARVREKEATRVREKEAARLREEEAARARDEEAARAREAKAARILEKEAARALEAEAARLREEKAAIARDEEATRAREAKAARIRDKETARAREEEAAQAREQEAAQARAEDAARAQEAKAERVREKEAARAHNEEAARAREEEATRAREEEAAAWLREEEAARLHEEEARRVREAKAARGREAEGEAAEAREAEAARVREQHFVEDMRAEIVAESPARPAAVLPITAKPKAAKPKVALSARRWTRAVATVLGAGAVAVLLGALAMAGRSYYARSTSPGRVTVDSKPQGVEVLLDGAVRGVTPFTTLVTPGKHALELRRGGAARQFALNVGPGAQLSQTVDWTNIKPVGTLAITSTPTGAKVIVDGKPLGVTPLTLPDLSVGTHKVLLESTQGTVQRDVKIAAGSEIRLDEAIYSGWIGVFAPFELQIYEGKHLLGTTETPRIMVPPGRHELQLVNERLGYRETHVLNVNPGETAALNIAAVMGIVRVRGPAGAEVWIDGERAGETPLGDLRIPVGTREIVVRHPQLGEHRVTATVTRSAPVEVNADFSRRPNRE